MPKQIEKLGPHLWGVYGNDWMWPKGAQRERLAEFPTRAKAREWLRQYATECVKRAQAAYDEIERKKQC
jgi:hypothetical protein